MASKKTMQDEINDLKAIRKRLLRDKWELSKLNAAHNRRLKDQADTLLKLSKENRALANPGRPKLGDIMVMHCEGPVVEVHEHCVSVDCGDVNGQWIVDDGDPIWTKKGGHRG